MALNYSRITEAVQALIQYCMPTGSIMPMIRSTVPPGWIQWLGNKKIYETEFPRLYEQLAGLPALSKGTDSTGKYVILPDIDGRVLQACSSISDVGKVLEAQLPNITGGFCTYGWTLNGQAYGAFYEDAPGRCPTFGNDGDITSYAWGYIDASKSSSVYARESASNVQPSAVVALMCIRF